MNELLANWQPLFLWFSGVSVLMALATVVCLPWVITHLPPDYFVATRRVVMRESDPQPWFALAFATLKNAVGFLLVILGAIMLVTPGQGLATILAGLMLTNFPGKFRLERWLVSRPGVLSVLNWLRESRGQEPFEAPDAAGGK